MERESLLTVLMILLGGAALQVIGAWLSTRSRMTPGFERERAAWLRLWWPLTPALIVAAWLCGWALSEPDPVPDRVGPLVFVVCAPFVLIVMRAILRAGWSLWMIARYRRRWPMSALMSGIETRCASGSLNS
jgi:hypothetical protein